VRFELSLMVPCVLLFSKTEELKAILGPYRRCISAEMGRCAEFCIRYLTTLWPHLPTWNKFLTLHNRLKNYVLFQGFWLGGCCKGVISPLAVFPRILTPLLPLSPHAWTRRFFLVDPKGVRWFAKSYLWLLCSCLWLLYIRMETIFTPVPRSSETNSI